MRESFVDYAPKELETVIKTILSKEFGDLSHMKTMLKELLEGKDYYCVCWDFEAYVEAQKCVDKCYKDKRLWNKMSILSTARSGKFSTDRTIQEYAEKIW